MAPRYRPPSSPDIDLATHAEKIFQLERSRDNTEEALGALMRELSEMRAEMKEGLAALTRPSKPPAARGEGLKLAGLLAAVVLLAQVVAELAKTLIHH